ncbi:MAG: hypothetical protein ACRCXZ_04880 [Patescibacteria group bacterium]
MNNFTFQDFFNSQDSELENTNLINVVDLRIKLKIYALILIFFIFIALSLIHFTTRNYSEVYYFFSKAHKAFNAAKEIFQYK